MSKILLSILMFMFAFSTINAQSNFSYGVKLGLSRSDFNLNLERPNTSKGPIQLLDLRSYYDGNSINPTIGFFLNYKALENLIIENELSYLIKGSRKTENVTFTTTNYPDGINKSKYTYEYSSHYIEYSLNLKPTMKIKNITSYLILGLSLNYDIQTINRFHTDITDVLYSYNLGAGIDISNVTNIPVLFELKYRNDFTDYYSNTFMKLKNRVFSLTIGIYL